MEIYSGSIWAGTWTCFAEATEIARGILPQRRWDVLILGCGDGKHTIPFLAEGHRVVALDDDPTVLHGGQFPFLGQTLTMNSLLTNLEAEAIRPDLLSIELTDYMDYEPANGFDVVLTSCSWQFRRNWVHPITQILRKIQSLVAPGGMIIADYMQPHGPKYSDVEHYLTPAQLVSHFDDGWRFHLNRDEGVVRERHINGEAWHEHRYASLVVQRLGREGGS